MSRYDYKHVDEKSKCSRGVNFEVFEPITAEAMTKCDVCKKKIERLISGGAGVIYKGSGWTPTYYREK